MKLTYSGTDGEVGGEYSWAGNKDVGTGSQKITKMEDMKRQETELKFGDFDGVSTTYIQMDEGENGEIKITWGMNSPMPRPYNLMGFMMKSMIEKDYDEGLANLKTICEKEAKENPSMSLNVSEMEWKNTSYLTIRKKIPANTIASFFGESFGKAYAAITKAGQKPGIPSGLVYMWDETTMSADIAAAVECPANMKPIAGLEKVDLAASKAVYVDFYGKYEKTGLAHEAINKYIQEHKLEPIMPSIEQYITDPMSEKDTAKWLTKVIYMVK
jgi:effector-binding domain-containing protein